MVKKDVFPAKFNTFLLLFTGICCGIMLTSWLKTKTVPSFSVCISLLKNELPDIQFATKINKKFSVNKLLFVGVMTTRSFIDTRALAVYRTWGQNVPGTIAIFTGEGTSSKYQLPVVPLPGVNDDYPPQKKSFMMLKFMHDHALNKFEWFMRADDDLYVRNEKLENFLRSLNSSKPLFIGQAGTGKLEETGQLDLSEDENFCMGGPGIVFSREALRRFAPHIHYCLSHLHTSHEDVEVGRCVHRFTGVPCTWSYEMRRIFYHNSSEKSGDIYPQDNESFTGNLAVSEVLQATTLHPFKMTPYMYRAHGFFGTTMIGVYRQKSLQMLRDVLAMDNLLSHRRNSSSYLLRHGTKPELSHPRTTKVKDILTWNFLRQGVHSFLGDAPSRGYDVCLKSSLEDIIMQVMLIINKFSRERKRVVEFREVLYGYNRLNPLYAVHYVLDLLLTYKKHRGRKMVVPVRRHTYIQQTFTSIEYAEDDVLLGDNHLKNADNLNHSSAAEEEEDFIVDKRYIKKEQLLYNKVINFILPLSGRFETFQKFMENFRRTCLDVSEAVSLSVILFSQRTDDNLQETERLIRNFQNSYRKYSIKMIKTDRPFSRGWALDVGAKQHISNALLFFVDVDISFNREFLLRARANTKQGQQVYFPIVFSLYNPKMTHSLAKVQPRYTNIDMSSTAGYWRNFGYGMVCLYKSDYNSIGGFDLSIKGWGTEDIVLYSKAVHSNLTVFRAPDEGLVHVFHSKHCDSSLEPAQLEQCIGSEAASYSSTSKLANILYESVNSLNKE